MFIVTIVKNTSIMSMHIDIQHFPHFRLSTKHDLILYLIKNELLGIRFIHQLRAIGLDTSSYPLELSAAIMALMGFNHQTDELCQWYYSTSNQYANQLNINDENGVREVVLDFYAELYTKQKSV